MDIGKWYSYTGTPSGSTTTQQAGIDLMVVSQNQINNTSLVRIRPWIKRTTTGTGAYNLSSKKMTIKANNSSKTTSIQYDLREANYNAKVYLTSSFPFKRMSGSGSLNSGAYVYDYTITHDDDGSKNNVPIYAFIPLDNSGTAKNWTVDIDIDLPKIARANTLTYSYTTIDEPIKFSISKASSNFTSTINLSFYKENSTELVGLGDIFVKTAETSLSYTLSSERLNQVLSFNKTKNNVTAVIVITTFNGNSKLGNNLYYANIPLKNTPPIVSATYIDTNPTTVAMTGNSSKIIKYVSKPKVVITATPQQQADIVSYSTIWGNSSSTTKETTFVNGIDSNILNVSAKDSRNWVGNISYDITENYIDYLKLGFEKFTLERPETTSNTINANLNGVWFNGNFGVSSNTLELKFRYKEKGGSYGTYQTITLTTNENKFSFNGSLGNVYNYQKQYDFEFVLSDKLMSLVATFNVTGGESIIRVAETYVKVRGDLEIEGQLNIGGSIIRKLANTDALQTNSNFIVNNTGVFNDMLTAKGVTLLGGKGSLIGANYGDIFPIGGIYVSSTNENPSSKLGGTWELVDKDFIEIAGNFKEWFTPSSNVTLNNFYVVRSKHSMKVRLDFTNKVALSDTAVVFGNIDYSSLGITDIRMSYSGSIAVTDGGNGIAEMNLHYSSGELSSVDVITKTSGGRIAANSSINYLIDINVRHYEMLDEACDKFYWKKIA